MALLTEAVLEALENARIAFILVVEEPGLGPCWAHLSPTAAALLGVTAQELIGTPALRWVAPEELARIGDLVARRARGEAVPPWIETVLLRPDGVRVPIEAGVSLVTHEGRPGNIAFFTDISERKRIEAALRSSEERFRQLIEHAPDAIAVTRANRFLLVNPALVALLDYQRADQLLALDIDELIHPDDQAAVSDRRRALFERGERPPNQELRFRRADHTYVTVEVASIPIEHDGAPASLAIARDITERRRLQAQLLQSDRMATVGTVAAGVAHEINNPLTYVLLNLDSLARELPRVVTEQGRFERALKLLDEARDGIRRVTTIVRDLRTFSRADADELRPIDVRAVLGSVLNIATEELRHRARLITELGEVPAVRASEPRLGQVFLNLLVNAAQAIAEGAPERNQVRVTTGVDAGGRVVVEVADSGAGIAPDVLPRIFDPFYTTKPIGVGTGLGLFICQNIVASMGGEILVDSELGRGSRFRVALPPLCPPQA